MIDVRSTIEPRLRRLASTAVRRIRPKRGATDVGHWDLAVDPSGSVSCRSSLLSGLTEQFGSPLHVVNGSALQHDVEAIVDRLEDCKVAVAYGLVSVGAVLDRVHDCDVDAVVGSTAELELSTDLGIAADRVVYAEPAPTNCALAVAVAAGVRSITLSSTGMTDRCASVVRESETAAGNVAVGWRIELDESADNTVSGSDQPIIDGVETWLRCVNRGEALVAAAVHVVARSPHRSTDAGRATAERIAALLSSIAAATGWSPAELVVSVEIPSATTREVPPLERRLNQTFGSDVLAPDFDVATPPADVAAALRDGLRAGGFDGALLIEPGTSLTNRSGMLLSTVLDVKEDRAPVHVILDAGINLATSTLSEFHQLINTADVSGTAGQPMRFAGPICTPADVLYANWRLPRAEIGDVVAILDTGARFVAESTSFSFPQPAVVICDDGAVVLARQAETFERLIALDVVPRATPDATKPVLS